MAIVPQTLNTLLQASSARKDLVLKREPAFELALAVHNSIPRHIPQPRTKVVVASIFAGSEFAKLMLPARRNHEPGPRLLGVIYAV